MIRWIFISTLIIIACSGSFYAQSDVSVSNLLRYGSGKQSISDISKNLIYRENLTDAKIRFQNDITIGFRLLYDNPPEVGQSFTGLSRRFIEYRKDDLYVKVGNFSELYGKGLALNLFENRGLAYDTWADGLKASYKKNSLSASMIYGVIDFADSINFWRKENYIVTGGNVEYSLNNYLTFGLTYIDAAGKIPLPDIDYSLHTEVPEFYINLNADNFKWFVNWSQKQTYVKNTGKSIGSAVYSSLSFNTSGLGIVIDYKNYRYDERNPYDRNDFTRPGRMLPFQNPPIVQKEHSYILLSRSIHEIDFNDEVGLQAELFFSVSEDTYINFNASLASRHNFYNFIPNNFIFKKEYRSTNYLPTTNDKYSPFMEYMLEIEHSINFYTSVNVGLAQRSKVLYNDFTGEAGSHKIRSTVVPLLLQHTFNEDYSAIFQYEYESVYDNYNTRQPDYSNHFISLIGNFYSAFNLNLRYEATTNKYDLSNKKDWFTLEAGYKIGYSHNISISYGRERGGQTCSNGVCRYILPFEGFKMTFLSNI
ncbi:MAG: hypothetical protein KKB34_00315 [Bacteroidetes bacterium]|nr:hypothetical protein [Bacteroidota bacterium]